MTTLAIYPEAGGEALQVLREHRAISDTLGAIGVQLERWPTRNLEADADGEAVKQAYADEIDRLSGQYGFQSIDVVALKPDNPDAAAMRAKFLSEHTHGDFEVRFFVDGDALFYLHVGDKVYAVLCETGDLISVPENTTHWFDMGEAPDFTCIRFFVVPEGWVAQSSGSDIATRHVSYEGFRAAHT